MPRSFTVSVEYIESVKKALNNQALTRNELFTQRELAVDLEIALSTVSKFFNGKPVSCENFIRICRRLNLEPDDVREKEVGNEEELESELKTTSILIRDHSLNKNLSLTDEFSETFLSQGKIAEIVKDNEIQNIDMTHTESLVLLVSSSSTHNIEGILEEIIKFKNSYGFQIKELFSMFIVHVDSLMTAPLNHPLHKELYEFNQLVWNSSGNLHVLVENILNDVKKCKKLNNVKYFTSKLSDLETSKKWLLTYIGENQLQKLGALVVDLTNAKERQIRSGYSYWGLGPACMWERACHDGVGYHMRENIERFPEAVRALSEFIDRERYNFVSLGVGEGSKDKVIIRDVFCSNTELYPRDNFLYMPVDMSLDMLRISAEKTQELLPHHHCLGIQRDIESYGGILEISQLAKLVGNGQPILYGFLGNTIANVESPEEVLKNIASVMTEEDLLLFEVQMISDNSFDDQIPYEAIRNEYLSGAFRRFVESALLQNSDLRINSNEMNNSYRVDISKLDWGSYGSCLIIDCFFENNTGRPLYITLITGDTFTVESNEKIRLLRSRKFPSATLQNFVRANGFSILGEHKSLTHDKNTGSGVMMLERYK